MWHRYRLDNTVLKVNEPLTLCKTENCLVEIAKGALAVSVISDDKTEGYVFQGKTKLLLDTIVETERGTMGTPVDKEIKEPFLMLGSTEELKQGLITASKEDFESIGYRNADEFLSKAKELGGRFFSRGFSGNPRVHSERGRVFAFQNHALRPDLLVVDGAKLVYKAADRLFVSDDGKTILKTPEDIVVARDGRYSITKSTICL